MKRFFPYLTWALFALPALGMAVQLATSDDPRLYHQLVHPTGEFAARFLIVAMMATPLAMLLRGWRGPAWLRRNRRYLGVAAFGYAALHTLFYVIDKGSTTRVLAELPRFYIWTGWLAFAIFLPLAATSMDWAVRRMGTWWKWVQRWTYPAAVLTLLHWAALHDWGHPAAAIVHFAPLATLEAYRVWYWSLRPRPLRAALRCGLAGARRAARLWRMSRVINLNRARKDKARRDARARADANAATFGLTKAERTLAAARSLADAARLDGHRREAPGDRAGDRPDPAPGTPPA